MFSSSRLLFGRDQSGSGRFGCTYTTGQFSIHDCYIETLQY